MTGVREDQQEFQGQEELMGDLDNEDQEDQLDYLVNLGKMAREEHLDPQASTNTIHLKCKLLLKRKKQ